MARRGHSRKPWKRVYQPTGQYETCPDCSDRDAVSFTFGHLSREELEHQGKGGVGPRPVLSFARSVRGFSLVKGCETCHGTGIVPVMRDTAIPAAN